MGKGCTGRRWYMVILGLLAIPVLFCVFKIASPKQELFIPGELSYTGSGEGEKVAYEGIALPAGGYRVEVEYTTDTDYNAHISIQDGTVFHGGLQTNGETVYRNSGETGFHMWLYEGTEQLQVILSYRGDGVCELHGVRFTEVNIVWTRLLTILLFVALVAVLCLNYHFRWSKTLNREQKTVIWGISLITLAASFFPLTGEGLNGIDLTFHYMRIEGVKDGILSGQIPVRIEPEWLFGQGFACAIFYCNTLLWFPALLRLLGFTVVASSNIFFVAMNLATALIAYHCFRRIFGSRYVGLACSALYTLSTYRIYKLYQTGDYGDGTALTFYPLILYGFYRVFTEDSEDKKYRTAWLPLTLGYAGLMQTHVLTCEITLFLTILLCLICIRKIFRKRVFLELVKGAAGAFALSLWYLVPFLDYYFTQDVHIKNLSARMIQSRGLTPVYLFFHFWRRGENTPQGFNGAQYTYPVGIGLVLAAGLILFLILWFNRFPGMKRGESQLKFGKLTALLGLLLVVMSFNSFPWDRIQRLHEVFAPLISSMEFQTRVLGWGTAFGICAAGTCLWYFERRGMKQCFWGGVLAVVISVITSTGFMSEHVLSGAGTLTVYNEEGMGSGFVSDSEFVLEGTNTAELTVEKPSWSEGVEMNAYEKYYLTVQMTCENTAAEEGWVDLPILSYRDYRARTESGEELAVTHNDRFQVRVLLPAGFAGEIGVRFESPLYWRISEIISVLAALLLFLYGVRSYRNRRRVVARKLRHGGLV